MIKKRIDQLLVDKKLVETRTKAQAMIMAGQIFANKKLVLKSGQIFNENTEIFIKNIKPEWVSRGALKLLHLIDTFKLNISNKICLDLGSSTGGFTEVLLKNGAKKIYSIDVGKNQLHEKLVNEKKIISFEKTNARYLTKEIIKDKIDIIVCDVSFISMKKVIQPSLKFLIDDGKIIGLIKPQFEAKKKEGETTHTPLKHTKNATQVGSPREHQGERAGARARQPSTASLRTGPARRFICSRLGNLAAEQRQQPSGISSKKGRAGRALS